MLKFGLAVCVLCVQPLLAFDSLDNLAADFWQWRAAEQPVTSDDIPRLDRPAYWAPAWSGADLVSYREKLSLFEDRLHSLDLRSAPVARQVDGRLIQSALARVRWELDVLRLPERNPAFYVDQTLGVYFSALLPPPPFADRAKSILAILNSIPLTLQNAQANLTDARAPFANIALNQLKDVKARLAASLQQLQPELPANLAGAIEDSGARAAEALAGFSNWLTQRLPTMKTETAIGPDQYKFFLQQVALLPYSPDDLLTIGKQEWSRSIVSQALEEHRNVHAPALKMFGSVSEQIAHETDDEQQVRRFLVEKKLLSVPDTMAHYRFQPLPDYLKPLAGLGETDDFTSPDRLQQNGIRYIDPPSPGLGYFAKAMATDPRTLIVHEGVPGHYFQMALSWTHADPIRRHYYDSCANEGIGFYAEEMMLHAGLFDDSPRSREIIWNFMRLRALRVEVDVKLATGRFSLQEAADYLAASVPMDKTTAQEEASFFAATPGQAISYLVGKVQIMQLLADYQRAQGANFDLQKFHDFLWQNGNVPIALQRLELLGRH